MVVFAWLRPLLPRPRRPCPPPPPICLSVGLASGAPNTIQGRFSRPPFKASFQGLLSCPPPWKVRNVRGERQHLPDHGAVRGGGPLPPVHGCRRRRRRRRRWPVARCTLPLPSLPCDWLWPWLHPLLLPRPAPSTVLLTYLPACLPACLPARLPACLPACHRGKGLSELQVRLSPPRCLC